MRELRSLEGSPDIGLFVAPHSVDDAQPVIRQGPHRYRMALALGSLAPVILGRPLLLAGRLPGELVQHPAQRFDARQPAPGFGMAAAFEQYRRSASQGL